jgi:hypothetical protein
MIVTHLQQDLMLRVRKVREAKFSLNQGNQEVTLAPPNLALPYPFLRASVACRSYTDEMATNLLMPILFEMLPVQTPCVSARVKRPMRGLV